MLELAQKRETLEHAQNGAASTRQMPRALAPVRTHA